MGTNVEVDFVVNCYERTYREVTRHKYMTELVAEQSYAFAEITLLINNVDDPSDARARAERLLAERTITRYHFVADGLTNALRRTGLGRRHLRRLPHFTDCCIVAVTLEGPEWLVYWDADARLVEAHDWISPTLNYMRTNPQVAIGNPDNWMHGLAEREALFLNTEFAIGYGFSDVAFLARRSELSRPVYQKIAPASWRYPLAAVEPIFEQRVDAWMRRAGRQRATYLPVHLTHPEQVGLNYPIRGIRERSRAKAQNWLLAVLSRSSHPALSPWP